MNRFFLALAGVALALAAMAALPEIERRAGARLRWQAPTPVAQMLAQVAAEQQQQGLPRQLDATTILAEVTASPRSLTYVYVLADDFEVTNPAELDASIHEAVCASALRRAVRAGATLVHVFRHPAPARTRLAQVTVASCP